MRLSKYLSCLLVSFFSVYAVAQTPEVGYSGEIPYISGGIGSDESDAIQLEAKKWPLMLQFSQIDEKGWGSWVSGVMVRIVNSQNEEVFACKSDGPFLLLGLKPGEYLIGASYEGVSREKAVTVKAGKPEKVSIYWK